MKSRILVVDDHPILRDGLVTLINRQRDLVCCGQIGSVVEVSRAVESQQPDLMLLDLRLGEGDGLELIKSLMARFSGLRILVLSQLDENVYAERVLRAGALGYVMKEQATEEVLNAIRKVLAGELYASPKIAMMALMRVVGEKAEMHGGSQISALSDRELHVFKAIGAGKSNKQIASELGLSVKTIETYREHIKYKLGFSSGAELLRRARESAADEFHGDVSAKQPGM